MSSLFLTPDTFPQLSAALASGQWVVACLCAGWCDVCKQYRAGFDALAEQYPDQQFVWIDIEDQSDLIGDLDVIERSDDDLRREASSTSERSLWQQECNLLTKLAEL